MAGVSGRNLAGLSPTELAALQAGVEVDRLTEAEVAAVDFRDPGARAKVLRRADRAAAAVCQPYLVEAPEGGRFTISLARRK